MNFTFWILDEAGEPQEVDAATHAQWEVATWGSHVRQLAEDRRGRERISTVFLGYPQVQRNDRPPFLWETMIFGGLFDGAQRRHRSRVDAVAGHREAVQLVEAYRDGPRRTRKSVRKYHQHESTTTFTRGDADRVVRFMRLALR